jgi:hypothetical protein
MIFVLKTLFTFIPNYIYLSYYTCWVLTWLMRLDQANLGHIKIIIPLPDLELNLKFCLFHVK